MRLGGLFLIAGLLAPLAQAQATLDITAQGVDLPRGAEIIHELAGLLCQDLGSGASLDLRARELTINRVERPVLAAGPVRQYTGPPAIQTTTLTNATLSLPRPGGWLGYDALNGQATLTFTPGAELRPEWASDAALHTGTINTDENDPIFSREWDGPALRTSGQETQYLDGSGGEFKIYGSEIRATDENGEPMTITTGFRASTTPIGGQAAETWVVVRPVEFSATLRSTQPCDAVSPEIASRSDSAIRFERATGHAEVGEESIRLQTEDFSARTNSAIFLTPTGTPNQIRVTTSGTLASIEVRGTTITPAPPNRSWIPWTAAGVLFLAIGALVVARTTRKRPYGLVLEPDLDAQAYNQLANVAAERDDYEAALAFNLKAQAHAPTSGRLRLDEAWYRIQMGQRDAALRLYDELGALGEPEADYMASTIFATRGESDAAAARLIRSLEHAPELALQAEDDPALVPLLRRIDVQRAILNAHDAID